MKQTLISSSKSYCFCFYFFTIIDLPIFDTYSSYGNHTVVTVALEKILHLKFSFWPLWQWNSLRVCSQYSICLHLALRILSLTCLTEGFNCNVTVKVFVTWSHNIINININIVHDDFCLLPATRLLSRPSPRMTKGNLIGYTTGGLPIYNFQTPQSVLTTLQSLLRQIVEQSESRQIFYFLCLNLVSGKFYKLCCNIGLSVLVISKIPQEFPLILFVFCIPLQSSTSFLQCQIYFKCTNSWIWLPRTKHFTKLKQKTTKTPCLLVFIKWSSHIASRVVCRRAAWPP